MYYQSLLKADPTDWLLEESEPSVRYFTLRDILEKPEDDPQVAQARQAILLRGTAREILNKQRDQEYLQAYPRYYTYKYRGLAWQLIALAELCAEPDEQIRSQCEYILENAQEKTDGGFSQHMSAKNGGGRMSEVIPCLTGNMLWCLLRFGYIGDARVWKGIDWLTTFMRFNDGVEEDPQAEPYAHYEMCWGKHTCHMGVVKALKALAAVPEERRTPEIEDTIARASEFLLLHHIHKRSHQLEKTSRPGWLKFGFPLMYQTDVLEILDILLSLPVRDSRMEEALRVVLNKQDELGRWRLENGFFSERMLTSFGAAGEPNKWITLRALRVLKRAYGG
ncbi:MAG: nitrogen fixation protein NifH [Bacillota bacterium]